MGNNDKRPKIRFKGFNDDWEQHKFKNVFNYLQNNSLSRAELSEDEGKLMNIHYGDILIKFGEIININNDFLPFIKKENLLKKYKSSLLDNGDIVIADAAEDLSVGKCSEIIGISSEKILAGLHTIPCRPKLKFAPRYLGYYMNSDSYHNQLLPIIQGTKVSSISKTSIKNTLIKCPIKTEEQNKIGKLFNKIDSLIVLHQRKLEKLGNIKKSMLEKMFPKDENKVPEIRFKGFNDDWEQHKLGNLGYTYTGLSGKTKNDFGHGDGKFITYINVFSNTIADCNLVESVEIDKKQNKVEYGDILFTTSSETPKEVGMSSVYLGNEDNIYLNSFCFGFKPTYKFDNYYIAYILRSVYVRKKIIPLAQGISRYNISKSKMMEIQINLPCMIEQKKIGEFFKQLDNDITLHQRKLEKLKNIKKACLEKMFV